MCINLLIEVPNQKNQDHVKVLSTRVGGCNYIWELRFLTNISCFSQRFIFSCMIFFWSPFTGNMKFVELFVNTCASTTSYPSFRALREQTIGCFYTKGPFGPAFQKPVGFFRFCVVEGGIIFCHCFGLKARLVNLRSYKS